MTAVTIFGGLADHNAQSLLMEGIELLIIPQLGRRDADRHRNTSCLKPQSNSPSPPRRLGHLVIGLGLVIGAHLNAALAETPEPTADETADEATQLPRLRVAGQQ